MARFNSTESNPAGSSYQSVLVTHVESPVLFYCRLLAEHEAQFARLQAKIDAQIETGGNQQQLLPDIHHGRGGAGNLVVLVYSTIRDRWCRGRLLSYQANSVDGTPINAKVCLIDYGSVEIVLWNGKYVRPSTGEISAFNDGAGFCFPCSLGNIKPVEEDNGKPDVRDYHLQWSSYANFLIDKETKNRAFLLKCSADEESSATTLTCDLLPVSELELLTMEDNFFTFSHHHQQSNFTSLSAYLVEANVARYSTVENGGGILENSGGNSEEDDNEKENVFIATNC